jgi:hypothetical protein
MTVDFRGAWVGSMAMLAGTYTSTGFAGPHDAAPPASTAMDEISLRTRNARLKGSGVDVRT